jgi:hypothetical protein
MMANSGSGARSGNLFRLLLMVSNGLVLLMAGVCAVYGLLLGGRGTSELEFVVNGAPQAVLYSGVVVVVLQMVLSSFGAVGAARLNVRMLRAFLGLTVVMMALELALFAFVLLAGNGVFSGDTAKLTDSTAALLQSFMLRAPATWSAYQDAKSCCGFDFRSTYQTAAGGYPGVASFDMAQMLSGKACLGVGQVHFAALHALFAEYSAGAQAAANADVVLRNPGYLCFDGLVKSLRDSAAAGGVMLGLLVFFQCLPLFFVSGLLFSIKEEDGGLKPEASMVLTDTLATSKGGSFFSKSKPSMMGSRQVIKYGDLAA